MRVIEYLFHNQPNLRVLARSDNGGSLIRYAACLKPELIVTHARLFGRQTANAVAEVKRSSPASKLILISSFHRSSHLMCESGADACLPEEALVRQLISVVQEILLSVHSARSNSNG
jgi:DNA-binding NarL/FixJ family response regulator